MTQADNIVCVGNELIDAKDIVNFSIVFKGMMMYNKGII